MKLLISTIIINSHEIQRVVRLSQNKSRSLLAAGKPPPPPRIAVRGFGILVIAYILDLVYYLDTKFNIIIIIFMRTRTRRSKISSYFAVFEPAVEGGYNVSFPDFPGCVTFGRSFEEAQDKAREVLELWLEELASRRQPIPRRVARPIVDEVIVAWPQSLVR